MTSDIPGTLAQPVAPAWPSTQNLRFRPWGGSVLSKLL